MFLLTLRDLQFRAVRFGIAILGVALVFAMVLLMSGLSAQFRNEPRTTVEAIGGDRWVIPEGVTGPFTSGATVPATLADDLKQAGADEADPVAIVRHTAETKDETKDVLLYGHTRGRFGAPGLTDGSQAEGPREAVASKESKLSVGETTKIGGDEFDVVGLTESRTIFGGTPLLFMDISDVQKLVYQG